MYHPVYVTTKWLRELRSPSKREILPPGAEVIVRRRCTQCKGTGISNRFVCSSCKKRYNELLVKDGSLPCGHTIQSLKEDKIECGVTGCDQGYHYYWVSLSQLSKDLPEVKDVVS